MGQMLQTQPALYCILLAENGGEISAVRALKGGAKDYLPLARITRDQLLAAITEACLKRRAAAQASQAIGQPGAENAGHRGSRLLHRQGDRHQQFLAGVSRAQRAPAAQRGAQGHEARRIARESSTMRSASSASTKSFPASRHRAIAEIYDFGSQPRHLYLAMEYFPCGDLRDRLRNPMSVDESLYYLRAIAEALRVIHVFGILHRDLKPANVMLREDNSPVLIDFGLARRSMDDAGTTGVGQVLGSPYYISPEQSQGQRVDARTDLYSLGVMFYEMLTGQRPYGGRTAMAIMSQHSTSPVPVLPEACAAQQPLLDRLMAKQQSARYASADELLADLGPLVAAVA